MKLLKIILIITVLMGLPFVWVACEKTGTLPSVSGVASLTIVNAIPTNASIIPVINTSSAIQWFATANSIPFGLGIEYSPTWGEDTVYVVQDNSDTLDLGPKTLGQMFYGILPLKAGKIYSLFLCGTDTTAPDFLFTTDSLPYHAPSDSTVGIRFVNLSTGSNPISINLEGTGNGSEVGNLAYKAITGFKNYLSNSSMTNNGGYLFVIRDASSGDSLTSFSLSGNGRVVGLADPNIGNNALVFKNVTIAFVGQPGSNVIVPQMAILVEDY